LKDLIVQIERLSAQEKRATPQEKDLTLP